MQHIIYFHETSAMFILGIIVKNLKIDFNTSGSQLLMTIYNYMISLSHLVTKHVQSWKKIFRFRKDFNLEHVPIVTKWLSEII